MKRWKWITLGAIGLAQCIQPDRSVPATDPDQGFVAMTNPSPEIAATLRVACYDCHSNETRYPWYAYITPVNWWVQESHVDHGRHHFNMDEWGSHSAEDRAEVAEEAVEMLKKGEMPLPSYTWLHADARLTDEERSALAAAFQALQHP